MEARILLVDDEAPHSTRLRDALHFVGYGVELADDCQDAINKLISESYDVVVTELHSPTIDGFQILRTAARLNCPPAVIVHTRGSVEAAVAAFRAGATDFLLKPAETDELHERVERALHERAHQRQHARALNDTREPMLRVGELEIDYLRHVVTYDGQLLRVTPIEYALLCCLARAEGQVVEGSIIVQYTHGHRLNNSEAQLLLKTHVRNLRRKLDPRYLTNIRGIGYRLASPYSAPQ